MKRLILTISILTLAATKLLAFNFSAVCSSGQTLYYDITSDTEPYTVSVTYAQYDSFGGTTTYYKNYNYPSGNLEIPTSVTYNGNDYAVTSIGNNAFNRCYGLTSATIPNSVETIGHSAFYGCYALKSVTIPNSVKTIGGSTFYGCSSLTSVTIPNSVTTIGDNAFNGCSKLASVTISNSVTEIGANVFTNCTVLNYYEYDNALYLGNNTNQHYALIKAKSTDIEWCTLNDDTKIIATNAFNNCSSMTSVEFADGLTHIGNSAFYGCTQLKSAIIPNSVTNIGGSAFSSCSELSSLTIGNSIKTIGSGAFQNCSKLKTIVIPNSVTSIGSYAFSNGTNLKSVSIPATVTTIGMFAFKGCTNATICCKASDKPDDWDANWNDHGGQVVWNGILHNNWAYEITNTEEPRTVSVSKYLGSSTAIEIPTKAVSDGVEYAVTGISQNAFKGSTALTSVTIPSTVTGIGANAFEGCTSLETISIPATVTSIGGSAFSGCTQLVTVSIPGLVTSIGNGLFYNCTQLKSVEIPASVNNIGSNAFRGCTALERFVIGSAVTKIGSSAFYGCSGLSVVYIPESVTSIGTEAFRGCTNAIICCQAANLPDGWDETWNSNGGTVLWGGALQGDWAYEITNKTAHTATVGKYSGSDTRITIPEKVTIDGAEYTITGIGENMFLNSTVISVTIPKTVTSIGQNAFNGCTNLSLLIIPNSVTTIGSNAFSGCTNTTIYCRAQSKPDNWDENWNVNGAKVVWGGLFDGEWQYTITSSTAPYTVTAIKYSGSATAVSIPDMVIADGNEYAVTAIGDNLFENKYGLASIEIPNTITIIGNHAFSGCSALTILNIPNSVISIGNYAFNNCNGLTQITIGNSVTTIGSHAFNNCTALLSVSMGNSVTTISDAAFYNCRNLTDINLPNTLTTLGRNVFYCCSSISTITISDKVTTIPSYAFASCHGLTSVTIGKSVKSIDSYAFSNCNKMELVEIPNSVSSIGDNAFNGCYGLTVVTIPNSVTSMGADIFYIGSSSDPNSRVKSFSPTIYCQSDSKPNGWDNYWIRKGTTTYVSGGRSYTTNEYLSVEWNAPNIDGIIYKVTSAVEPYMVAVRKYLGSSASVEISPSISHNGTTYTTTSIESNAFPSSLNLTTVIIPNSVTTIGGSAFNSDEINFYCAPASKPANWNNLWNNNKGIVHWGVSFVKDNMAFLIDGDAATLAKYCGTDTVVTIPASVTYNGVEYAVTAIGDEAFYIDTVVNISGQTFLNHYGYLKSITIPNSVTKIGDRAFYACFKLNELTIPNTVAVIGDEAFGLVKHVVYSGSAEGEPWGAISVNGIVDGDFVFSNQTKTELVAYIGNGGSVTIPNTVTAIGGGAFFYCDGMIQLTIPSSVTEIGEQTFFFCNGLTSLSIPNSVTNIGERSFSFCTNLTSANLPNSLTSIGVSVFSDCYKLASVVIPNSVTSIGEEAFAYCESLTSVNIPTSVTSIGKGAFGYCESLAAIDIPTSVKNIGEEAFEGCESLKSVTIPLSVTAIDDFAFYGCDSATINCQAVSKPDGWSDLWNLRYYDKQTQDFYYLPTNWGVLTQGDYIFRVLSDSEPRKVSISRYIGRGGDVIVPGKVTISDAEYTVAGIENAAFSGCWLTSVVVPKSVESMGNGVFSGCSSLKSITLPFVGAKRYSASDSYQQPFGYIFGTSGYSGGTETRQFYLAGSSSGVEEYYYIPSGLKEVVITDIKYLPFYAFGNCKNIESVRIPNNVEKTNTSSFLNCSGLNRLNSSEVGNFVVPDSLITVGKYMFYGCTSMEKLVLPKKLNGIENSAFDGCTGLKSVAIPNSVVTIGESAFANCSNLASVVIPNSVTKINEAAFAYSGLTSVILPNSLRIISNSCFEECENLASVTVSNSVTTIGERAFFKCKRLTEINIPNSVKTIGNSAFEQCSSLTSITIPHSVTELGNSVFYKCERLESVVLPNTLKSLGEFAFSFCGNLRSINLPKSLTVIDNWAFQQCGKLVTLTIPSSVKRIGVKAFLECEGLRNIDIPNSVTVIDSCAFIRCTGLKTVTLGNSVTNIVYGAFGSCQNLTSINFPQSLKSIGDQSFEHCIRLPQAIIPKSVTSMGLKVFYDCSSLHEIYCLTSDPSPSVSPNGWAYNWNLYNEDYDEYIDVLWGFNSELVSISATPNNTAYGYVDGVGSYIKNRMATLSAEAAPGCRFVRWSDGIEDNPREFEVTKAVRLVAEFEISNKYTIASSDSARGTVTDSIEVLGFGVMLKIKATPKYGYHFERWKEDGDTLNVRALTLERDTVLTAVFVPNKYNLALKSKDERYGKLIGGGAFDYNTTNTISVEAGEDYLFLRWSDGDINNPRKLQLVQDTAFEALFVKKFNDLKVESNNNDWGTTSGSGSIQYNTTAKISAKASAHYHFMNWNDGDKEPERQITVLSDTLFMATFAIDSFNLETISNNDKLGTVKGAGIYPYNTEVEIVAMANPHSHFVKWSNGSTETKQTIAVTNNMKLSAQFELDKHRVTVTTSDSELGNVSGSCISNYGSKVLITATPGTDKYFTGWSDGVTSNPRLVEVLSDTLISANFKGMPEFTIKVASSDTAMGTVSAGGTFPLYSTVSLSATPKDHYRFVQWSDGRAENPRSLKAIANVSYTALFEPEQYSVVVLQNDGNMGYVSPSGVYSYGSAVTCEAMPYPHHYFVEWSNGETANPYVFSATESLTLTAVFAADSTFVTAVADSPLANEVNIYAYNKTIVVENAEFSASQIDVFDINGRMVAKASANSSRIEIPITAQGIYIVRMGELAKQVVVN